MISALIFWGVVFIFVFLAALGALAVADTIIEFLSAAFDRKAGRGPRA